MDLSELEATETAPAVEQVVEPVVPDSPTEPVAEPPVEGTEPTAPVTEPEKPAKPNYENNYNVAINLLGDYLTQSKVELFKADLRDKVHGELPAVEPPIPVAPEIEAGEKSIYDMTASEFIALQSKGTEDGIKKYESRRAVEEAQKSYAKEVSVSEAAFEKFLSDGKFTKEDEKQAYNEVSKFEIDFKQNGNYAKVTKMVMRELIYIAQSRGQLNGSVQDAIDKNQELLNTTQPIAAAGTTTPTVTEGDKFIEGIQKFKKTRLSDLEKT